jgi:hypothetical protein
MNRPPVFITPQVGTYRDCSRQLVVSHQASLAKGKRQFPTGIVQYYGLR